MYNQKTWWYLPCSSLNYRYLLVQLICFIIVLGQSTSKETGILSSTRIALTNDPLRTYCSLIRQTCTSKLRSKLRWRSSYHDRQNIDSLVNQSKITLQKFSSSSPHLNKNGGLSLSLSSCKIRSRITRFPIEGDEKNISFIDQNRSFSGSKISKEIKLIEKMYTPYKRNQVKADKNFKSRMFMEGNGLKRLNFHDDQLSLSMLAFLHFDNFASKRSLMIKRVNFQKKFLDKFSIFENDLVNSRDIKSHISSLQVTNIILPFPSLAKGSNNILLAKSKSEEPDLVSDTKKVSFNVDEKKGVNNEKTEGNKKKPIVHFVTSNPMKTHEVERLLSDGNLRLPFEIEAIDIELPELQEDPVTISREKCRLAASYIDGPCIVEDTSLCFSALDGLPGPYIKWFLESIGNVGLCNMLAAYNDKSAYAMCKVSFSPGPSFEPVVFCGKVYGEIVRPTDSLEEAFGWDPIFLPSGYEETFSEMSTEEKNKISHRSNALAMFQSYVKENKEKILQDLEYTMKNSNKMK